MKLPERFAEVSYVDRDGQLVPKAVDSKGNVWLQVEGVPAMGASVLQAAQTEQPSAQHVLLEAEEGRVESTHYVIEWNTDGQLTAVFSKDLGRNILKGKGNVFQLFEDKPMKHDAWDIDIFYQEKCCVLKAERIRVSENNPLFASIQFEYSFGQSRLTQEMKLYHHTPRIDFETEVDWKERQQLLKVGFEVDVRANHATYDMQYGNLERANNWNTSWDYAKFETVGHQRITIDIEGINWWNETNLMEKDISPVTDTPIELSLTPYEIKTIRIGK